MSGSEASGVEASRYQLLDPPHKGIRHVLGLWALESGRTDYSNPEEVRSLQELSRRVLTLLEDHGRNEDQHVFPLLERVAPGSTASLHNDHERLDAHLETLVAAFSALEGNISYQQIQALHLAVTDFQAHYLLHMLREEREFEPLLWQHYTDEELLAEEAAVVQDVDFSLLLEWFAACVPARSVEENRQVLTSVRAAVPPEAFDAIVAVLQQVVEPERLTAILA